MFYELFVDTLYYLFCRYFEFNKYFNLINVIVWTLTVKSRLKSYQATRYTEEAEKLGIKLKHVCSEDFEIVEPSDQKNKIWHKGRYIKVPDVLITRLTGMKYFSHALVRLLKSMGVIVINSPSAIEIADDKLRTIQVLTANNLPIPKSILAKYPVDIDFIANKLGFPLIMKTVNGAKGEGVLLFDNYNQFKDVITVLHKATEGKANIIFQEFISNSYGRDLRVYVVGDRAVGAVIRQGASGQFKANVSAGGNANPYKLSPDISKLAVKAAKVLGLTIAGVDLLIDEDKFLISEVNATPSFKGFETTANINVPKMILEYALRLKSKLR